MTLLDANLTPILEQNGHPSTRLSLETAWLAFSNVHHARMIKKLAPFLEWVETDDGVPALKFHEATGIALTITGISASAKPEQFNETFFSPEESERVWGRLLNHVEVKAYSTLGALCEDLRTAYEKLPGAEQSELAFQGEQLLKRVPPGEWPPAMRHRTPSFDWEDLITYGLLAARSHKLAGMLQRFIFPSHQTCFCSCKLFTEVCRRLVADGTLSEELVDAAEEELDDDAEQHLVDTRNEACIKVARAVVNAMGDAADLENSMMASPADEAHAPELLLELIAGSKCVAR